MSRAAYNLEFFPRRRSGFKDAGFAMEQFSQVITGDCFVYSKHTSHLFLMLDFDPQSPDHTSVTFTEPLVCADIKSLSRSQINFFLRSNRSDCCSCSGRRPKFQRCPVNCRARFVHPSRGPNRWVPIYPLALPALCHYKCFSMIFFHRRRTAPANAGEASHSRGAHVVPPFQRLGAATDSDGL